MIYSYNDFIDRHCLRFLNRVIVVSVDETKYYCMSTLGKYQIMDKWFFEFDDAFDWLLNVEG